MLKKALSLPWALLLIAVLCSCSAPNSPVTDNSELHRDKSLASEVTLVVTRDFGKELFLEREVDIESGTSAMDALQMVADVETKYGGGFVSSINGISSEYEGANKNKQDWFLYINGVASNLGPKDYILQDGDLEHWDLRDWSYNQFVPAIVGDFPQPFQSGYKSKIAPTLVVYEEPFVGEAESVVEKLKEYGVTEVSAVRYGLLSDKAKEQSNLIIIAGMENGLISELNKAHRKLGFYAYMELGEILLLDAEGNLSEKFGPGCGLIQATQNPWHPKGVGAGENAVWMVTGTDINGVKIAATVLANNHDGIRYAFALLVSDKNIMKIP